MGFLKVRVSLGHTQTSHQVVGKTRRSKAFKSVWVGVRVRVRARFRVRVSNARGSTTAAACSQQPALVPAAPRSGQNMRYKKQHEVRT